MAAERYGQKLVVEVKSAIADLVGWVDNQKQKHYL
jgi:hypothetical protein